MQESEVFAHFGVTSNQLDSWEADAAKGVLHGKPQGPVTPGRPTLFGQKMKQVGFREPLDKVAAIDKRAAQFGMRRSDYLRHLVDADLAQAGIA